MSRSRPPRCPVSVSPGDAEPAGIPCGVTFRDGTMCDHRADFRLQSGCEHEHMHEDFFCLCCLLSVRARLAAGQKLACMLCSGAIGIISVTPLDRQAPEPELIG
jgi:hypothetical protein